MSIATTMRARQSGHHIVLRSASHLLANPSLTFQCRNASAVMLVSSMLGKRITGRHLRPVGPSTLNIQTHVLTNLPVDRSSRSRDVLQSSLSQQAVGNDMRISMSRNNSSSLFELDPSHAGECHGLIIPIGGELVPCGILGLLRDRLRGELVVERDKSMCVN